MTEIRLLDVLDRIQDNVLALDNECRIVYVNKAYAEIFGVKPSDIIGKYLWKVVPKTVGTIVYDEIMEAIKGKQVKHFEWKGVYADCFWETDVFPSDNGVTIISKDITERKMAEEEIAQAKQRLDAHMNNSPEAVVEFDPQFCVLRWSEEAERIFGWLASEIIGKSISEMSWVFNEDVELVQKLSADMLTGKRPRNVSFNRNYRKDGSVIYCEWYNSAIYDSNGKLISILSQVLDVTERRKSEEALRQAQAKLQEYTNSLERLVEERTRQLKDVERLAAIGATAGMVGHDIRNPLQAIVGDLYLIDDDAASLPEGAIKKSLQESVSSIQANLQYIDKIVEDLQDFAKPLKPAFEKINLDKVIEEVMLIVSIPSNLQVVLTVEEGLPKFIGDYSMLKRILANLVQNAVQAMPNGGKLTINAYRGNDEVFVSVEDTGVGIPEEVKAKLFQPMVTTKAKGQGFGLAVVKRLVDALDGTIMFQSQEGKGTKFVIKLPY